MNKLILLSIIFLVAACQPSDTDEVVSELDQLWIDEPIETDELDDLWVSIDPYQGCVMEKFNLTDQAYTLANSEAGKAIDRGDFKHPAWQMSSEWLDKCWKEAGFGANPNDLMKHMEK